MSLGSALLSNANKLLHAVVCAVLWCLPLFSQVPQPLDQKKSGTALLRIIVVSSLEQAQQILSRLKQGEDFEGIARKESIDSTSAEGGSLGEVTLSSLRPELRDALVGLASGQISPIVKSPLGFAILKVETGTGSVTSSGTAGNGTPVVNSLGSVKQSWGLGGLVEAEVGLYNFPKPAGWERDLKKICELRKQSLAHEKESMERFFSPANSKERDSLGSMDLLNTYYSLGEIYSYQGDMEHAIPQYENAYQIAAAKEPAAEGQMDESLGI